ncbi:MAG: DUF4296 domain-containing protein [Ferruginibacter sp.]
MMKYLFIFCCTLFIACSPDRPDDVLPPEKMQQVLWDYIRADVYASEFISKDSSKNAVAENAKLQLAVFKKHKISKEQFYKSYGYYASHNKEMRTMLDSITAGQQRLEQQKSARLADSTRKADSLGKITDSVAKLTDSTKKRTVDSTRHKQDTMFRKKGIKVGPGLPKRRIKLFKEV